MTGTRDSHERLGPIGQHPPRDLLTDIPFVSSIIPVIASDDGKPLSTRCSPNLNYRKTGDDIIPSAVRRLLSRDTVVKVYVPFRRPTSLLASSIRASWPCLITSIKDRRCDDRVGQPLRDIADKFTLFGATAWSRDRVTNGGRNLIYPADRKGPTFSIRRKRG